MSVNRKAYGSWQEEVGRPHASSREAGVGIGLKRVGVSQRKEDLGSKG